MNVEEAARAWHEAGASVLPAIRGKRPDRAWSAYQDERLDPDEPTWGDGLGLVTGYGGIEMLEIEGAATATILDELAVELLNIGLLQKLMTYCERTPSGGFHWIYRREGDQEGSQKLARGPDGKTWMETRGKFAWTVTAPSGGRVHDEIEGGEWTLVGNSQPGVIPTFTEEEIEQILEVCRSFDRMPPVEPQEHRQPLQQPADGAIAPGQDYQARNTWEDILEPLGWRRHPRGWTRPGKRFGLSATITPSDNLYIWSSSLSPLEPENSYTKFRFYSLHSHGGDDSTAARALSEAGYGVRAEPIRMINPDNLVARPRLQSVPTGPASSGPPPTTGEVGAAVTAPVSEEIPISLTEHGNALLVAQAAAGRFLYVPERKSFAEWDGNRWHFLPDDGAVIMLTRELLAALPVVGDVGMSKHKHKSLGGKSITTVVSLVKSDPSLRVGAADLDSDAMSINTPDGILHLDTATLTPADPAGLHTRVTGCGYDPVTPHPMWDHFLSQIFLGDADLIDFVQRLAGYSATGKVTHHVLPFLHGQGANGKSVLLEVLQGILGDYATTAPADFLLANGRDDPDAVARLAGQRLVVCSEVPPTAHFNESKIKILTGGDRITARHLYERNFTWTPTHHLWLAGNHQPRVQAGGDSFWRRLRLVPFEFTVSEEEKDPDLARKLIEAEGPAILAWLAEGARKQVEGLAEPATVKAATMGYAEEEDALGRFLAERVVRGGDPLMNVVNTKTMYSAYESWCHSEGLRPLTGNVFGREIKRHSIDSAKRNGQRFYLRVTLLNGESEEERPEQYRF